MRLLSRRWTVGLTGLKTPSLCASSLKTTSVAPESHWANSPPGQFAADVRYLARQAYPEFPTAIQEELATDAFLHGLTPGAVRNQVRLDTPQTLDAALARAKLAEVVLGEQSPLPSTAKHPPRASTRRIQSTPMRSMGLEPSPDARNDLRLPGKPETRICWRCGQRGHLWHNCGTLPPTSPSLQPGNDMGPM
ncbi:UNVERIFIED_CONTAM: hypothetical protein FKN15_034551 [Acipenser sinensis]